ncbi:hypothetical protein LDENG_00093620 [Lucifuga dentata]|nr:hypothetical protein LDENG_00093620 [Lucifuga dentata]
MLKSKAFPNQPLPRRNSMLDKDLPALFTIYHAINFHNVPNLAGWNAAPYHA